MNRTAAMPWSDPSPHEEGFVTVNGARLQYLDWGGEGPALILIHGVTDNPHAFDDLAPHFIDRFRVLAYARRGHGSSQTKAPYDTATLTEDLRGFMDALGIEKANLAGWSMGGNEITKMAGDYPERVARIVYLDGAYDWADPDFQAASKAMPASLTNFIPSAMASFDAYLSFQNAQAMTGVDDMRRVEAYLRALVVVEPNGTLTSRTKDIEGLLMESLLTGTARDYSKVRCPALALNAQSMFDLNAADPQRRRDALDWEEKYMIPFRRKSVERVRQELADIEVVSVPGTHGDFFVTSRDQIVREMRRFLLK